MAVPAFIHSDFTPFITIYERLEKEFTRALIIKTLGDEELAKSIVSIKDFNIRRSEVVKKLKPFGIDSAYAKLLWHVDRERETLSSYLTGKRQMLGSITDTQKNSELVTYSKGLIYEAKRKLNEEIGYHPRFTAPRVPYDSYYALNILGEGPKDSNPNLTKQIGMSGLIFVNNK